MNIEHRLAKLEGGDDTRAVIVMWRTADESDEQAEARWIAENGPLPAGPVQVILVRWVGADASASGEP